MNQGKLEVVKQEMANMNIDILGINELKWIGIKSVCVLSHVCLFVTLWTVAHQALLSMKFSRQEYWSGLPLPTLGNLPNPGIQPASHESSALAGSFFTIEPPGKPQNGQEWVNLIQMTIISTTGGKNPLEKMKQPLQ